VTREHRLILELDDQVNMGNLENVRRLLQNGADLNSRNALGDTPLMAAAYTGQPNMVRLLLHLGADATLANRDGKTAQQLAEELSHTEVLAAFTEHATR